MFHVQQPAGKVQAMPGCCCTACTRHPLPPLLPPTPCLVERPGLTHSGGAGGLHGGLRCRPWLRQLCLQPCPAEVLPEERGYPSHVRCRGDGERGKRLEGGRWLHPSGCAVPSLASAPPARCTLLTWSGIMQPLSSILPPPGQVCVSARGSPYSCGTWQTFFRKAGGNATVPLLDGSTGPARLQVVEAFAAQPGSP